jgi:hypothetical protein
MDNLFRAVIAVPKAEIDKAARQEAQESSEGMTTYNLMRGILP